MVEVALAESKPAAVGPSSSQDELSPKSPTNSKPRTSSLASSDWDEKPVRRDDDADPSSSASDISDDERSYATDTTTPAASDVCPDERYVNEVEAFRDREYPQLDGTSSRVPIGTREVNRADVL